MTNEETRKKSEARNPKLPVGGGQFDSVPPLGFRNSEFIRISPAGPKLLREGRAFVISLGAARDSSSGRRRDQWARAGVHSARPAPFHSILRRRPGDARPRSSIA